jgi:predicted metal-binding protein
VSLVTTPVRELATCASCSGTRVTDVTMTLTDGSLVDFTSCHSCEHKVWSQDGRSLDITTVLRKAKKEKVAK